MMSQYDEYLASDAEFEDSEMEFESDNNESAILFENSSTNNKAKEIYEIKDINEMINKGRVKDARLHIYSLIEQQPYDSILWFLILKCWSQEMQNGVNNGIGIDNHHLLCDIEQFVTLIQRNDSENVKANDIKDTVQSLLPVLHKHFMFTVTNTNMNMKLLIIVRSAIELINKLNILATKYPNISPILQFKLYYMRQWETILTCGNQTPYYTMVMHDILNYVKVNDKSNDKPDELIIAKINFLLQCFLYRFFYCKGQITERYGTFMILNMLQDFLKSSISLQHDFNLLFMFHLTYCILALPTEYSKQIWSQLVQVKYHISQSLQTSEQLNIDQADISQIDTVRSWLVFVFVTACSMLTIYEIDTITPMEYKSLKTIPNSTYMQNINKLYDDYLELNLQSISSLMSNFAQCYVLIPKYVKTWLILGQWYYLIKNIIPMYDCISIKDIEDKLQLLGGLNTRFDLKTQLIKSSLGNAPFTVEYQIDFDQEIVQFTSTQPARSKHLQHEIEKTAKTHTTVAKGDACPSHYLQPATDVSDEPSQTIFNFVSSVEL